MLYVPSQVCLCICLLYRILGWSAFLGMIVIVVMLPLPGYVAKFIQDAQVMKMKKVCLPHLR